MLREVKPEVTRNFMILRFKHNFEKTIVNKIKFLNNWNRKCPCWTISAHLIYHFELLKISKSVNEMIIKYVWKPNVLFQTGSGLNFHIFRYLNFWYDLYIQRNLNACVPVFISTFDLPIIFKLMILSILCETGSIHFKPEAYFNFTILSLIVLYIPFFMNPFLKNFLIPLPGARVNKYESKMNTF